MDEKSLKYAESHEWISVDGDVGTVGISNNAQDELGDVVYVEVFEVGEEIEQFEECGSIESVKAVSPIKAPVSGEILEINEKIEDEPGTVNKDPYGDGWLFKMKVKDTAELDKLMDYSKYQEHLENS